jgi:bifunctional NMN adenylyltransferase/nudix hydrolase
MSSMRLWIIQRRTFTTGDFMEKTVTYAVVVGRFQVSALHQGHKYLLTAAATQAEKLIVVIGVTEGQPTSTDPLDFKTREQLILHDYPEALVLPMADTASDRAWSDALDTLLAPFANDGSLTLFGSRDSFLPFYSGVYPVSEIDAVVQTSGSVERAKDALTPNDSAEFRKGMIYAAHKRFPTSYQAVDIAIIKRDERLLLLGRKSNEDRLRFIGGFVDPTDTTLEAAAHREAYEEAGGIEITLPRYITSRRIDDVRYRKGPDKIMTCLFLAEYVFGHAYAQDDIAALAWVPYEEVEPQLMPEHKPLWHALKPLLLN